MGRRLRGGPEGSRVGRTCSTLATDFDADRALDDIELLHADANASHASMPQHDRSDVLGQGLDKIDMAATDDKPNRVEDDVVGEDRAHIVRLRAGASHQGLDVEDYPLLQAALEIIGANLRGNDKVAHEHPVDLSFGVAPADDPASEQSPIDLCRRVRARPFTRDQIADERNGLRVDRASSDRARDTTLGGTRGRRAARATGEGRRAPRASPRGRS